MENYSISISGVLAVGKTSFAEILCDLLGMNFLGELVDNNRYLKLFYTNPHKYAFQTEINMLYNRWNQHEKLTKHKNSVQDRSIFEDPIFADVLHSDGILNNNDYKTYVELFNKVCSKLQKVDVLIILEADTDIIMKRIKKRNREMEKNITRNYIEKLQKIYKTKFKKKSLNYAKKVICIDWNNDKSKVEIKNYIIKLNNYFKDNINWNKSSPIINIDF
jgi:deoxyadenosine/deoxycytidine kinase